MDLTECQNRKLNPETLFPTYIFLLPAALSHCPVTAEQAAELHSAACRLMLKGPALYKRFLFFFFAALFIVFAGPLIFILHSRLMLTATVAAVIWIMGQCAGKCKIFTTVPAFSGYLSFLPCSLTFFFFPGKSLPALFAVIWNMLPGRINRKSLSTVFACFFHPAGHLRNLLFQLRFRFFFPEEMYYFFYQVHKVPFSFCSGSCCQKPRKSFTRMT